jgi:TP901 family phage tail tape measure protein
MMRSELPAIMCKLMYGARETIPIWLMLSMKRCWLLALLNRTFMTQDLEIKLNRAKTQLAYMEQDLKKVNQEIEVQSTGWYKLSKSLAPLGQSLRDAGQKMEAVGKNLSMKVTAPLMGLGAAAVKVGSDFETGMSEVAAISGATSNDLKRLEEKAREMGATTKFSATEASEGLKYMAMAGWETSQMLDGLEGVMMLAAASGEDLGRVSDIVTDALTAFGLEAKQAGEFADLLASASSSSNTNVSLLGESFKHVAPLFGSLGYSAEDAALALGLMANAGIKGSQAGTTLRGAITNLANPTDKMQAAMKRLGLSITDAQGEMLPFKDVMDELREKFAGLTEEQQAQEAATIFGKQAMAGMLSIINASEEDYKKLTSATRNYSGTAKEMAEIMEDNLQGGLTKLKSALEGVGIQIFELLIPHLQRLVGMLQKVVDWFANLSPATQETIVKVAALAAAIGPLLLIGGKLFTVIGSVMGALSTVSGAIAVVTTGAAAATPAVGALATAFTVLTGPVGLAVAAIAGLTVAGVALYKHLQKDSIPAVQLFGGEISEATEKAVGGFLELNDETSLALKELSWSTGEVTAEMAETISGNFSKMAEQVQAGLDKHHQESLAKIESFVHSSTGLSKEEQNEILGNMQKGYEDRKQSIADGEARIKEMLDTASAEKRALTRAEQVEINTIQQEMMDTGIRVLSENEIEAKAIMERMKEHAGRMSALQAAEVVKNSVEQKDKAVEAAEEQYNEVIKEIIRQRDEAGTISGEQADKLIKEATRQKDESIRRAEEMHQRVIAEAKAQAKEHVSQVDWETGEIKSKWQVMKSDIAAKARAIKEDLKNRWEEIRVISAEKWGALKTNLINIWEETKTKAAETWESVKESVVNSLGKVKSAIGGAIEKIKEWNATSVKEKVFSIVQNIRESITRVVSTVSGDAPAANFSGTSFFPGGLTMVGELGPELVALPRGARIYNDRETSKILGYSKGITQNITIISPKPLSERELAREFQNTSRKLALGVI